MIVKKMGARQRAFLVTENIFQEYLDDIIQGRDQPSNDGINTCFVSRFAKSYGLNAALSGLALMNYLGGY